MSQLIFHPAHPSDGSEMKRYSARVRTADRRVNRILQRQGETDYVVSVYACGPHGALDAAVEKAQDKWFRHRGWLITDWVALDVVED